jgi:hypothetical protein
LALGSRLRERVYRLSFEPLEDRLMLDSAAIVVGRTLSTPSFSSSTPPTPSYFVGQVQNHVSVHAPVWILSGRRTCAGLRGCLGC